MAILKFLEDIDKKYNDIKLSTQNAVASVVGDGFGVNQGGKTQTTEPERVIVAQPDGGKVPNNAVLRQVGLNLPVSNTQILLGAAVLLGVIYLAKR